MDQLRVNITRSVASRLEKRLEKASEEAANALWQLAAKAPSCNAAIRDAQASGCASHHRA